MNYDAEIILFMASVIVFISVIAVKAGSRFWIPALLLFLGIGMLFGSDGLGIQFSNPKIAQFIGIIALNIILFSGGMDTNLKEVKDIAKEGVTLATIGVFINTFLTGVFIYLFFHILFHFNSLSVAESMLMAAVMSSTDSASVFSILRSKNIRFKHNIGKILELESGSNDPMAFMLTIFIISYIKMGGASAGEAIMILILQLGIGLIIGFLFGKAAVYFVNKVNIVNSSLYPIMLIGIIFLTYSVSSLAFGNGYLSVYVAGLIFGNAKIIHKNIITTFYDSFVWLWQIVMFFTLGLLVNPHELLDVWSIAVVVGLFMIFVARPAAVFLSLLPFKDFSTKGRLYISWLGLRGAVPIIFATYPLTENIENADLIFNVVFFITILSLLIQGTTASFVAKKLGVLEEAEKVEGQPGK